LVCGWRSQLSWNRPDWNCLCRRLHVLCSSSGLRFEHIVLRSSCTYWYHVVPCCGVLCWPSGASEHDLMSRIIETLGPPPEWMMAAAKRTDNFFKRVPTNSSNGNSNAAATAGSSSAAAAAAEPAAAAAGGGDAVGGQSQSFEYVLYSREEFEALNKCQVSRSAAGHVCDYHQTSIRVPCRDAHPPPPGSCLPSAASSFKHLLTLSVACVAHPKHHPIMCAGPTVPLWLMHLSMFSAAAPAPTHT
jgi:hypothetical protein